jgi:hypothetical protein
MGRNNGGVVRERRIGAMIVGAQKSGTTSLLRHLAQHPSLRGHTTIECAFFADEEEYRAGWGRRGLGRYFPQTGDETLIAKNVSVSQESRYLERLAKHNPDCLVVLVLRDPVARAFSSYRMERNAGWVHKPFDHILTALDDPTHAWRRLFLDAGDYAGTLDRISEHFPLSQLVVFLLEDLHHDPAGVCRRIFEELGVDTGFVPDTTVVHNAHHVVRSRSYAELLKRLRDQRNRFKRAAKAILPTETFHGIGQALVKLNYGLVTEEEITAEACAALGTYYHASNTEVARRLGRDLSHWTGMSGSGARRTVTTS